VWVVLLGHDLLEEVQSHGVVAEQQHRGWEPTKKWCKPPYSCGSFLQLVGTTKVYPGGGAGIVLDSFRLIVQSANSQLHDNVRASAGMRELRVPTSMRWNSLLELLNHL
jgi:hypothetical protein